MDSTVEDETTPLITRKQSTSSVHDVPTYSKCSENCVSTLHEKCQRRLRDVRVVNANNSHCHAEDDISKDGRRSANLAARKSLIIASILCLAFMVAEIVGGYLAESSAVMTDAAHLLADFASFMISLLSLFLASRPATRRMSFGWHRAEVLGAFASVILIWVITGVLVYIAIERIVNATYNPDGEIMLITASLGVAVNLVLGLILHRSGHGHSHGAHSHGSSSEHSPNTSMLASNGQLDNGTTKVDVDVENYQTATTTVVHIPHKKNVNVRAAMIHIIGDLIQSVGVLIAACIVYFKPTWGIVDPICTFFFSILVLITTIAIMRDALHVLMEGIPRSIDFADVVDTLASIEGVLRVHDLRIWSLTMDKAALAVHLATDNRYDSQKVLKHATDLLRKRYNIYECTVQIELFSDDMDDCSRCEPPKQ